MAKYSKYVGVTFDKRRNKWIAQIKNNGKTKFLGQFDTEENAHQKRISAELEMKDVLSKNLRTIRKQNMIQDYINGMTINELSEKYDRTYVSIYEMLLKEYVPIRDDRCVMTNIISTQLVEQYENGNNMKDLSDLHGISISTISRTLRKNTKTRSSRKYHFKDENFLKHINEDWKAYFLGLFYADGNMRNTANRHNTSKSISITLTEADSYILDRLNSLIFVNPSKLYTRNSKIYKCKKTDREYIGKRSKKLSIHSSIVYEALISLGCTPNKSLTIELPSLNDEMFPHFLRGYMDGDGWYSAKSTYGMIGSYKFCEQVQQKLKDMLNIHMILKPCGKVCRLLGHRQNDYDKFRKYLYSNSTIHLLRKYNRS